MSVFRGSKPIPRRPYAQPGAAPAKTPAVAVASPPVPRARPVPSVSREPALLQPDPNPSSPVRRLAFYFALAFVFSRFSFIHEILSDRAGIDLHLVTLIGVPAVVLMFISGAIQRTLRSPIALWWLAFAIWLVLATPFSSWRSGSLGLVLGYYKAQVPVMFVIGGLISTWREFRAMMITLALAAAVNVFSGRFFEVANSSGGRLQLEFGSIANSNDFVAHLFFVLPFLAYIVLEGKKSWLIKGTAVFLAFSGLYFAARSASRGGLIAFASVCAFVMLRGRLNQRILFSAAALLLVVIGVATLPSAVLVRYATLFGGSANSDQEAVDSQRARTYLLKSSIGYTLEHPIFGVGPGEFSDVEGGEAHARGQRGAWQVTHNAYTQASSEAGIPALFFVLAGIISTFLGLNRIYREAKDARRDITAAAYCLQISLIGFSVAIIFLALVYTMYLPALAGLTVALQNVWKTERARLKPAQIQPRTL